MRSQFLPSSTYTLQKYKAADYGIVGDAFEVLPKITEAVKKLKSEG